MLIKSIFMELRARLRSCNVYITTNVDFAKNCNLKINIKSDCIVLNYYEDYSQKFRSHKNSVSSIESLSDCSTEEDDDSISISVSEFCQIIPNSMSGLKIDGKNIYFRVLTESKTGGSFYRELLSSMAAPHDTESCTEDLKVSIEPKLEVKLICDNCSNVISKDETNFDRILELPTVNLDFSEWFCHHHGGASDGNEIKQDKSDFLYRLTFFVVNCCVMTDKCNKFNSKREIYHCNRCLAWLGLKTKETVKLYNSTVRINQSGQSSRVFTHPDTINDNAETIEMKDFIYTVEKIAKEFNIGYQYNVMCKIVLECSLASDKKQYLLIWIMDKELQVLQGVEDTDGRIKLKSNVLKKILYKVEAVLNEEVETWISDPVVVCTEVSRNMFVSGVRHLTKMSMKVPEYVRSTNGYTVSYLNL